MTRILFCHNATDRLQAAAAWLVQQYTEQHTEAIESTDARHFVVYVPQPHMAQRLDQLLWTNPPTGFVPHCSLESPLADETPIVLTSTADSLDKLKNPAQRTLLNLADELQPAFLHFASLIEIVSREDSVRLPARERARHYLDQGHSVQYLDLQNSPNNTNATNSPNNG